MRWLIALALSLPIVAEAHGVDHARQVEIERSFDPANWVVTVRLVLDKQESDRTRKLFDRNRNGLLDPDELVALRTLLESWADTGLSFYQEDKEVFPERSSRGGDQSDGELVLTRMFVKGGGLALSVALSRGFREEHVPVHLRLGPSQVVHCNYVRDEKGWFDLPVGGKADIALNN